MYSEAAEELSLDSPVTKEAPPDVNHQKDENHQKVENHDSDDVVPGAFAEPVDNHSHDLSSEPPKLSISESAVSPPIPKSQSVPEVSPAAKARSAAKVGWETDLLVASKVFLLVLSILLF